MVFVMNACSDAPAGVLGGSACATITHGRHMSYVHFFRGNMDASKTVHAHMLSDNALTPHFEHESHL